jgi:uncharacterized protein YdeI (YjbR/CyaY-like superfamily)
MLKAFARLSLMPAPKRETKSMQAKMFEAVLERTADRLRWVIARIPIDLAQIWGKRGQIKVQGEINGFAFTATLFPDGQGHHFLIVNKKMLNGGKTAAGLTAKFRIQPDTTPRITISPPAELLRELAQSKRLLKFFESLSPSRRHEISKWIAQCKTSDARKRRSQRLAEWLMETMEAELALPPIMQLAFRQNPKACAEWNRMSPSHRRAHLISIFHYREPEARARRLAKMIEELTGRKAKSGEEEDFSETI